MEFPGRAVTGQQILDNPEIGIEIGVWYMRKLIDGLGVAGHEPSFGNVRGSYTQGLSGYMDTLKR